MLTLKGRLLEKRFNTKLSLLNRAFIGYERLLERRSLLSSFTVIVFELDNMTSLKFARLKAWSKSF